MRRVLYILGQLDDRDVAWLARSGIKRLIPPGAELVREGEPSSSVYFLIDGQMTVTAQGAGQLATLGVGDVIGELSFVDSAPPAATVTAQQACVVLDVAKTAITAQLDKDPAFALRFYKAIAFFLADRLRHTVHRLGFSVKTPVAGAADHDAFSEGELDERLLDKVALAGDRFDRLVRTLASAQLA